MDVQLCTKRINEGYEWTFTLIVRGWENFSSKIVLSTFLFAFVRMNKKVVQNLVHIVV